MKPDFYLASSEGYGLDEPRRCYVLKQLCDENGAVFLLVRVDPPIVGQRFGMGGRDLDQLVLAPRHAGDSLSSVRRWPVFVHVGRMLASIETLDVIRASDWESFAWAEIYETEAGAREKTL